MPSQMSASMRFSSAFVFSTLCLTCLLVNCAAAQQAVSPENVAEELTNRMTEGVTEGMTVGVTQMTTEVMTVRVTEGVAEGVTKGVKQRVGDRPPNPWQNPEQCRRPSTETSWFCDVDGVLTKEEADSIDSLLVSTNANASCVCNCSDNATLEFKEGYVVAAAVVTSLDEDLSIANRSYHLERFGDAVRQDWFSNRTCDDSALILAHYMYNCSKIYISLGSAFDSLLPSQTLPSIYDAAQPSLETGNIEQALTIAIQRLNADVDQAMITPTEPPPNNLVWGILGVITISSILLFHYWIKY